MSDSWNVLGITATQNVKLIKRAYAQKLKCIDPDTEIQAFQLLRAAYEDCISHAKGLDKPIRPHIPAIPNSAKQPSKPSPPVGVNPDTKPSLSVTEEPAHSDQDPYRRVAKTVDQIWQSAESGHCDQALSLYRHTMTTNLLEPIGFMDRFQKDIFERLAYWHHPNFPYQFALEFVTDVDFLNDAGFYTQHQRAAYFLKEKVEDFVYYQELEEETKAIKTEATALKNLRKDLDEKRNKKLALMSKQFKHIQRLIFKIEDERPSLFENLLNSPNVDWWRNRVSIAKPRLRHLLGSIWSYFFLTAAVDFILDIDLADRLGRYYWVTIVMIGPILAWLIEFSKVVFRYQQIPGIGSSLHEFRRQHTALRYVFYFASILATVAAFLWPSNYWWVLTFVFLAISLDTDVFLCLAFLGWFTLATTYVFLEKLLPDVPGSFLSHTMVNIHSLLLWFYIISLASNIINDRLLDHKRAHILLPIIASLFNFGMYYGITRFLP